MCLPYVCGDTIGTSPTSCTGASLLECLRELRPQNHMATPAAKRIAAAPIAIPPIAPPEIPPPDAAAAVVVDAGDATAVEDAIADAALLEAAADGEPSLGQFSPGSSTYVLPCASCFCFARLVFALGLMTPTMP